MKVVYILATVLVAALAQTELHSESVALKELKSGNLLFSAKAYKELAESNTGNFLVCPLSVIVVLALVEAGSGGETAKQLISGLNLPATEDKIHEAIKAIAPSFNVNAHYTLTSANKVYVKEGFKVKEHFKEVATNVFNAEIEDINFSQRNAAATINGWVSKHTHDKIHDLVSQNDLGDDTRAVLINALYFYGLWQHPFYVDATNDKAFHVNKTKEVNVKMMEQTNHFNYYEDTSLNAKFLEMHYSSSPVSMTFVLPNDVDGLAALEAKIDKVLITPKYQYEKVHVQIPHVNVEHKINFIPILESFGIKDAFDNKANFTQMVENAEDLVITQIIQKTLIAVEEKGTTAAAATAVIFNRQSALIPREPSPPKEFEANHPFIFILKSQVGVLFVGRYAVPNN